MPELLDVTYGEYATTYAAGSLLPVEVRGGAELGAALGWAALCGDPPFHGDATV